MKQPAHIQISIPQPCHEKWNDMSPQDKGRFCDSCQKSVVDFTGFTDEDLRKYLYEHRGQQVCGRFQNRQLNRPILIPQQPHSQLYKWMIAAGLAVIFTSTPGNHVFAKAPWATELSECDNEGDKKAINHASAGGNYVVKGCILDNDGAPVIGATLVFKKNSDEVGRTVTLIDGTFSITLKQGNYLLFASHPNYELPDIIVVRQKEIEQGKPLAITFRKHRIVMGMVSCQHCWKWDWEYTKIPFVSPPQD